LVKRASELSGGNQQKLLLARIGGQSARLLLADEPTRGIDIGAKTVILETLRQLAETGLGVIVASSDLEEVSAVSDRIYVLREKRVVAELDARTGTDVDQILSFAFGYLEGSRA
jgi:ABC-type sugar transport system ATPase subunit